MSEQAHGRMVKKQFFGSIEPLLTPLELEKIETAYIFSKYGHRNQVRDGGDRYFEHPRAVAWIIINELKFYDWQTIVLALLHDIKEDSYILSWHRIQLNFGRKIAIGLKLLTKDPKDGYLERLRDHGTWRELLVKICDRVHNLRTLTECSPQKQRKQIQETEAHYISLCETLLEKLPRKDHWRGEYLRAEMTRLCHATTPDSYPTSNEPKDPS